MPRNPRRRRTASEAAQFYRDMADAEDALPTDDDIEKSVLLVTSVRENLIRKGVANPSDDLVLRVFEHSRERSRRRERLRLDERRRGK